MADISNSALWQLIWSVNLQAERVAGTNRYLPLPIIEVPFLLENPIVAVLSDSRTAPPTWHFAAYLIQKVNTGVFVGSYPDAEVFQEKIWLNRVSLFRLPKFSSSYSISFSIPYWFYDINLKLWIFTGADTEDTAIDMTSRKTDLLRGCLKSF